MAFQEKLQVEIETIFDSAGFDKLQQELKQTKAQMAATFGQVKQLRNLRREADKFGEVLQNAGLTETGENVGQPFRDMETGQLVDAASGTERMADAMDRMEVASAGFSENVSTPNQALQGVRDNVEQITDRMGVAGQGFSMNVQDDPMNMQQIRNMETPDTRGMFSGPGRSLTRFNLNLARMSELSSISRIQLRKLGGTAMSFAGTMRAAAAGTQQLQMRLLGLQFTMMTIAFVFGGMMMSALGAVGVFKVLGNTLKFLFLPTALNVLGGVLDIQDAVMGLDKDTRRLIGDIFFWIAAITALISIFAVLGKGLITVVGILNTLGGWLLKIGQVLWSIGSAISAVTAAFIGGLVGAFLIVVTAAKKFGKMVALAIGVILIAIGAVVAAVASIPAVIAAAIGVVVGAILGLIWTFKDEIVAAISGLISFLVNAGKALLDLLLWPFKKAYEMIVGNSIIPDLVNDVMGWLMKLPKAALNIGSNIVNSIVKGIKGIGNGIWNALKSVLPDFIVDALEGAAGMVGGALSTAGNVAGGIANTVGNLAGGVANAAGNFASGVGNAVGGFFGGGNNQGGGANVQNNQINASVQIQDSKETPQETGRKFGQGVSQGLNNQTSNISSGT